MCPPSLQSILWSISEKKGDLCLSHPAKLPDCGSYLLLLLLISPSSSPPVTWLWAQVPGKETIF